MRDLLYPDHSIVSPFKVLCLVSSSSQLAWRPIYTLPLFPQSGFRPHMTSVGHDPCCTLLTSAVSAFLTLVAICWRQWFQLYGFRLLMRGQIQSPVDRLQPNQEPDLAFMWLGMTSDDQCWPAPLISFSKYHVTVLTLCDLVGGSCFGHVMFWWEARGLPH